MFNVLHYPETLSLQVIVTLGTKLAKIFNKHFVKY